MLQGNLLNARSHHHALLVRTLSQKIEPSSTHLSRLTHSADVQTASQRRHELHHKSRFASLRLTGLWLGLVPRDQSLRRRSSLGAACSRWKPSPFVGLG